MCYLIAKNIDAEGCVALRTTHGKHLSTFKRSLEQKVGYKKIQLVIISRPSAYGEYGHMNLLILKKNLQMLLNKCKAASNHTE